MAGPVRVVAAICPGGTGSFHVAARIVDSSAVVSLHEDTTPRPGAPAPRKDHDYRLDCCYPKDDHSCRQIFHGEVKPLVDAIFRGINTCAIVCGAPAKTNLIMAQPAGLLAMAMEQILLLSQPIGAAVSVSSYQVLQDTHVFDLLEPKDHEVLVLEDADGRTNLKGLSRVHVKSIQEFADLCSCSTNMLKQLPKPFNNLQARGGHHGFIIYVSRLDQDGKQCAVAKMNFLDLAGYVDPKQSTNGGGCVVPNSNKSMYALINVVQALNTNQSFIPYRQSKLTRILQDSLCKTSSAVLIACLDEISRQDVVSTISLASRSSQRVNEQCYNLSLGMRSSSTSNINLSTSAKNLSRSLVPSVHQSNSALNKHSRAKFNNSAVKTSQIPAGNKRSKVTMHSVKKTICSLSTNMKQSGGKPALIGRKLFCPRTNLSKEDKIVVAPMKVIKAMESKLSLGVEIQGSLPVEGCDETNMATELVSCNMQKLVSSSTQEKDFSSGLHPDHSSTNLEAIRSSDAAVADDVEKTLVISAQSSPTLIDNLREISNSMELLSSSILEEDFSSGLRADHSSTNLENICSSDIADDVGKTPVIHTRSSPKLSDKLREISNSLKFLSTKPISVGVIKPKTDLVGAHDFQTDLSEPKTPETHLKFGHSEDSHEFKARTTGIKKTMVKECLMYLNSANKEQLKSLKGIGEKRANRILELREESPEPFKDVDDLKNVIKMNKKEIKTLMSTMFMDI